MNKNFFMMGKVVTLSVCAALLCTSCPGYADTAVWSDPVKIDGTQKKLEGTDLILDLATLDAKMSNLSGDNSFALLDKLVAEAMAESQNGFYVRFSNADDKNVDKLSEAIERVVMYRGYSFDTYHVSYVWNDMFKSYSAHVEWTSPENSWEMKSLDEWVAKEVKKKVTPLKSDTKKIAKINEIIAKKLKYDTSLQNKSAYAGVFKGKTICGGYSVLGYKMLKAAGFKDTITVAGDARGREGEDYAPHRWNMICLNGRWYHIDFTFNDPISNKGDSYYTTDFLLKSDDYMKKTHKWDYAAYPSAK